jgi:methionyl-tRNA formyltransferase
MDQGIDTGEIYVQQKFAIDEDETGYELYTRGMTLGAKMLAENFSKLINNEIVPTKQEGIGSYYGKKRGRYIINWQQRTEDIRNMIRVHAKPYNPAETLLLNRYLIINKAKALYDDKYIPQGPGKIVDVLDGDRLVVSCSDGCLILEDYEIFPVLNEIDRPLYLKKGNTFG